MPRRKVTKQERTARYFGAAAAHNLRQRGFERLIGTRADMLGKPMHDYDWIEVWGNGTIIVFLVLNTTTGSWDLLAPITWSDSPSETWEALDRLVDETGPQAPQPPDVKTRHLTGRILSCLNQGDQA